MKFEELYQELARGVEMIRALVWGMTGEQARSRPQPSYISSLKRSIQNEIC